MTRPRGSILAPYMRAGKVLARNIAKPVRFATWLAKYGVRNPSDPRHNYDYYGAWQAGITPKRWLDLPEEDREEDLEQIRLGKRRPFPKDAYLWPDEFKLKGHEVPKRR